MEPYSLQPPSWRPLLHSASAALGVPDFFPPQAGAPELDISDVSAVRNGIAARSVVGNETFSAHEMIYDRLKSPNILAQLNGFMGEILKRREELARLGPSNNGDGGIDKPTHKLPSRVTPNDSKLAAYVRELADSQVSLSKLAKTVPHGFKGEKMLDMLYNGSVGSSTKLSSTPASATSNTGASATASVTTNASGRQEDQVSLPKSVPVDRALWFIQVVGATEMASHSQSQAHYHAHGAGGGLSTPGGSGIAGPTGGLGATHGAARVDRAAQVQLDFTNAVCSWLRRMLADLDVPASADAAIAESAAVLGGTEAASAGLSGSLLRRTFAGTQAPPPLSIRNNLGSASAPYPSPLLPASASTINLSRQANLSLSFTSTTGVPKAPFSAIAPSPSLSPNLDAVRIPMTPSRSAGGNSNFSFPGNPVPFSSPSTSNGPPPFTLHHQHTPPTSASASTRWAHKWSYALSLLRGLVTLPSDATPDAPGSLLQLPSWLRFLAELLGSANVAQIPFVLAIVLEFGIGWPPAEGGNASGGMTKGTLIARIGIEGALKARREVLALRHALLASLVADPIAETDGAEKGDGVVDADIGIQGDGDVSATVGASEPGTKTAAQDEMDVSVRRCDDLLIALISLARHLARGCDQALISPRLWSTYSSDLRAVLGEATFYADLQQRNSVLMLRHLSADGPRENWFDQQAADIEILDSIDLSTHWQTTWVQYFTRTSSQPASRADGRRTVRTLRDKVELLFLWACTSHRSSVGPSRPYIVGVFLSGLLGCNFRPTKHLIDSARKRWDGDGDVTSLLKERAEFAKLKAHATQLEESKAIDFHSFCIQFIADVESYCNTGTTGVEASDATETLRRENFASVSFDALIALIEELSNLGYFSMRKLLRKMTNVSTAAGSLPANTSGQPTLPNNSFQTRLLRSLPFPTGTQNLTNLLVTRRALIYGNRAGETWEEATERRATREVRALFSGLFQTDHAPFDMHGRQTSSISDFADEGIDQQLITTLPHLWSSPPFVQRRITRSVLLPAIEAAEASASISFTDTCLLLALLRKSEDFRLLNQVIMTLLRPGRLTGEEHGPIADKVSDAIICHAEVWKALDSLHVMVEQVSHLVMLHEAATEHVWRRLLLRLSRNGSREATGALAQIRAPDAELQDQLRLEVLATLRTSFHRPEELVLNLKGCIQQYGSSEAVARAGTQAAFEVLSRSDHHEHLNLSGFIDMLVDLTSSVPCNLDAALHEISSTATIGLMDNNARTTQLLVRLTVAEAVSLDGLVTSLLVPFLVEATAQSNESLTEVLGARINACQALLIACKSETFRPALNYHVAADAAVTICQLFATQPIQRALSAWVVSLHDLCADADQYHFLNFLQKLDIDLWQALIVLRPPVPTQTWASIITQVNPWQISQVVTHWSTMESSSVTSDDAQALASRVATQLLSTTCSVTGARLLEHLAHQAPSSRMWSILLNRLAASSASCLASPNAYPTQCNTSLLCLAAFREYQPVPPFQPGDSGAWSSILLSVQRFLQVAHQHPPTLSAITVSLDILSLAAATPNIWMSPIRMVALSILSALLHQLLRMAKESKFSMLTRLLDVVSQLLEEMPADVLTACQAVMDASRHLAHDLPELPAIYRERILRTLSPDFQQSPAAQMILAPSVSAAVHGGRFRPVLEKSWELLPTLEPVAEPDFLTSYIPASHKLPNTGSLSLIAFGAMKLPDTVSLPPLDATSIRRAAHDDSQVARLALESERSYGAFRADTPAAMATRRGLVFVGDMQMKQQQQPKEVGSSTAAPASTSTSSSKSGRGGKGSSGADFSLKAASASFIPSKQQSQQAREIITISDDSSDSSDVATLAPVAKQRGKRKGSDGNAEAATASKRKKSHVNLANQQ